jgi:vacuolar protein sorting-associated protein 35
MYVVSRKHFSKGGAKRLKYLLVPLVFRALRLAIRLKKQEEEDSNWAMKAKKVFIFAHETATALSETNLPELSLRLFLQCAQAANACGELFETIAYEFVTQVRFFFLFVSVLFLYLITYITKIYYLCSI